MRGIPRLSDTIARGLAARGHQVTVCNGRVRCRSTAGSPTRLRSASSLAAASHGRQRRAARVSQHIEPTGLRPSVLPACGLSDYLRRHASAFDVAHLHACRNLPGAIAARRRAAGVPYLLAPTERRRIWSDAAPKSGCSISSWASSHERRRPSRLRSPTPNAGNWRGWVYRRSVYAWCQTR